MRHTLAAIAFLALTAIAVDASADDYDAAMARAAAAKEKALDQNDPASWLETFRAFEDADGIRATRESKFELAVAATKLKYDDVAFQAFEDAIALGLEGSARAKADAFLAEKAGSVARLRVVGPAGAEVSVGGRRRAVLPLTRPLVVFAGPSRVTVRHDGRAVDVTVVTEPAKEASLDVTKDFTPPPSTPVPAPLIPKPAPPVAEGPGNARLTWIVVGGATFAIGIAGYVLAQATIDARRDSLSQTCIERAQDYCVRARPEYMPFAQSDGDAIASWKAVRVGALATAGVGALLTAYGVYRATVRPDVTATTTGLTITLSGRF